MFNIIKNTILGIVIVAGVAACSGDDTSSTSVSRFEDSSRELDLSRGEYACYGVDTTLGAFTIAVDEQLAPLSSANFAQYVSDGFYDGVIFHNVIKDMIVETGSLTTDLHWKETNDSIISEANNGLENHRGRIAMTLSSSSSTPVNSGFFINVFDIHSFDGVYAVIGGVVEGMDVIDAISDTEITTTDGFNFLPSDNVVINSVAAQSCPAQSEIIEDKYPEDTEAEIDLSRGDYSCYTMVTSLGSIELAIDEKLAPASAANFKQYVDDSFYDGVIFHRVVDDFVIQSGGFTSGLTIKDTGDSIRNEATNGLKNYRGRLAMARTSSLHSATSQFYINLVDNTDLDFVEYSNAGFGYAVFGGVISGMDIVDQIGSVQTSTQSNRADVPVEEITVDSITPSSCPVQ